MPFPSGVLNPFLRKHAPEESELRSVTTDNPKLVGWEVRRPSIIEIVLEGDNLSTTVGTKNTTPHQVFVQLGEEPSTSLGTDTQQSVDDLIGQVKHILGTDRTWNVLLVGAGNLGRALMAYRGFDAKGFKLVAVFDNDPAKVGTRQGSAGEFEVRPLTEMRAAVQKLKVQLGIIAVPPDTAQDVADQLVEAGIRGLMNFAPVSLHVPGDVAMNAVDLAVQLEQLSFQVNVAPLDRAG